VLIAGPILLYAEKISFADLVAAASRFGG